MLWFDPRPVHVNFVVDNVALGQVFHPVLPFSPLNILYLYLHIARIRRTDGQILRVFQKAMLLRKSGALDIKSVLFNL